MRSDYFQGETTIRLQITKAAKKKLNRIQEIFFPSFSQSSVAKILLGVFVGRHKLKCSAKRLEKIEILEATNSAEYVEIVECNDDELRMMKAITSHLEKDKKRLSRTAVFAAILKEF